MHPPDLLLVTFASAGILLGATQCSKAASPEGLAYCALYAREQARLDIMHTLPVTPAEAASGYPLALAKQVFSQCVFTLPLLLPLSPNHRSMATWEADMEALVRERLSALGVVAATEAPEASEASWRASCAAEYVSWDPESGTVIRRGSPERVPCPCEPRGDVQCVTP